MTYTYTVRWPTSASSVSVTGNFDNWSQAASAKQVGDVFEQEIRLEEKSKLVFKFVVDGEWHLNRDYKTEWDGGVENNVVLEDELVAVVEAPVEEEAVLSPSDAKELHLPDEPSAVVANPDVSYIPAYVPKVAKVEDHKTVEPEDETAPKIIASNDEALEPEPKHLNVNSEEPKAYSDIENLKSDTPSSEPTPDSFHTDEDILSDFDESVVSAASPFKDLHPKNSEAGNRDNLTQVLTSSSSFAAVSLPSSTDDYHDLGEEEHPATTAEDSFNTPTNSLFNSVVLPTNANTIAPEARSISTGSPTTSKAGGSNTANTSVANFSIDSRNNSFTNKPKLVSQNSDATIPKKNDDVVEILKAPGGYPSSPKQKASSEIATPSSTNSARDAPATGRRENLISRFKGLFKY